MSIKTGERRFLEWHRATLNRIAAVLLLAAVLMAFPALSLAAITATVLAEDSNSNPASSFTTAQLSPAPSANALILAWVTYGKDQSLDTPALSGNGLTWVQVGTTVGFNTTGSPKVSMALFRAMGASPNAGSVTISFANSQKDCAWTIVEFGNVDASGSNGSGAVVQYAARAANALNGAFAISLSALGNPKNASAGGFSNNSASITADVASTNTSSLVTGSNPGMCLLSEWYIPGIANPVMYNGSSHDNAGIAVEIMAASTVLGNSTDPPNVTIAPGGPATPIDSFTFHTTGGTAAITDVTVTLAAGSFNRVGLVEITDSTGSTVYGSVANPASDTPTVPLTTNITATMTPTTYKVRITPQSHASMPAPPGGTYAVTAYISNWSDTNIHAGSDTGGTTVSIDNLSPGNVTAALARRTDTQISLGWSNPADTDFIGIVVLRRAGSAVTDVPVEGSSYTVGNTVGSSTVACVVASPGVSCNDTGLTRGTYYYYKAFARDTSGNYSASGVALYYYLADALVKLSSEGDGSYLSDNVYEASASTQVKSQGTISGSTAAYTVRFQNHGTDNDTQIITGTGTGSNFTVQYLDDGAVDRTAAVMGAGYAISGLAVGAYRDWTVRVTPNGGGTPVPGGTSYNVFVTAASSTDNTRSDQVKTTTTSTSANITLLKSPDKTSYSPGDDITYTTTASNGANLSNATSVIITDPIPADTGFKIGGSTFDAGSSTLTSTIAYSNGSYGYSPVSGGCGAPAGYDYCVTQVSWTMTGNMPTGTNFTCYLVVRVK